MPRLLRVVHRFRVAAQVNQALQRTVERPARFQGVAQALVYGERFLIKIQRLFVLALAVVYVAQCAQAGGPRGIVSQALRHQPGGARHSLGLPYIHLQQAHYLVVQTRHRIRPAEVRPRLQ